MYPHPRLAHQIAVESWKWIVAVSLKVMKLIRSSQPARTPFWTGSNWYQLISASKHHLMTIPYHLGIAHVKHVFLNVLSCACAFVFCIFFPLARVNCPGLPVMLSKRQGQPADALRWKPHRYAKWHLWLHFPDWFSDTQTPAVRMILTVFHSRRALYVAMKTLTLTLYSVEENSYDCPRSWRNMSNIATAPVLNPSCLQSNSWARYQTAGVRGTLELQPNSDFLKGHLNSYQSAVKSSTSINQTCHEIIRKSSAVGIADQILFYPDPFQDDLGNLRSYWPTNWTGWKVEITPARSRILDIFDIKLGHCPKYGWTLIEPDRSWWFQKLPKPVGHCGSLIHSKSFAHRPRDVHDHNEVRLHRHALSGPILAEGCLKETWGKSWENAQNWRWMWAKKNATTPLVHLESKYINLSIYQPIKSINQSIYLSIY